MKLRLAALAAASLTPALWAQGQFHIEEASIAGIQSAIRSGQTTCRQVVEAYVERARAYNGACTALVTKDGTPIPASSGPVRAGGAVANPTQTVAASKVFQDFDRYTGTGIELGKMVTSVSDASVQLQYGWRVGIPNAGQLNALETLNIRGERSVTCKGEFDKAPSAGPLPPGAPKACEEFRKMPDAVERAAELDKKYGRNPNLEEMPMYCAVFSAKDWYEAKDMRSTGGNDVNFAMDAPKKDSPDIAILRQKGAIVFAIASASNVTFAAGGERGEGGPLSDLQYALWSGQACNPYDTERIPRGTSNGSGVSVAANLSTCSICEQSLASCKGPASRNNVVNVLTTKGVIGDGGLTGRNSGDRTGIHCKSVTDAVTVLDAIKGYKAEDPFSALPKGIIPAEPYKSFLVADKAVAAKPLQGVRVGIVREFMVKHTKNDAAISDQMDKEIKSVLRDKLGAELVESVDPKYPDDPSVPNMKYTFQDALAEILPHNAPEYFWQMADGQLEFAVPGWDVRTVDYAVAVSLHKAPLSPKITLRRISARLSNPSSLLLTNRYLADRGDERVKDWKSWVENAQFKSAAEVAGAKANLTRTDVRASADGVSYMKMQAVLRLVILKVMRENKIDVFVNPEQTTAPYRLGYAPEPDIDGRLSQSCCGAFTALAGSPEIDVPAGYTTVDYEPKYVLSADGKTYTAIPGDVESKLPHAMPVSLMFWAGPGFDPDVIKAASAYESATHHRVPPPDFGPVTTKTSTR